MLKPEHLYCQCRTMRFIYYCGIIQVMCYIIIDKTAYILIYEVKN